jgi:sterol desaturase/sphingolipid hydroxylase (fatty acid hydroxylase superfamily)
LAVLFLQNIYDTFGHLGYEFFPQWILRNKWICAVQATPSHHDAHHRYFRGNYSHYFNIWDLLMRTEIPKYSHMRETVYQAAGERPLPNALRPKALAPARDESRHPVLTPLRGDEFAVPTAQHASL